MVRQAFEIVYDGFDKASDNCAATFYAGLVGGKNISYNIAFLVSQTSISKYLWHTSSSFRDYTVRNQESVEYEC